MADRITRQRAARLRSASFDDDAYTIDVVWTTGAAVPRMSWEDGDFIETLSTEPACVRLDRLNAGAPFLDTHDSWSLGAVIGSVVPGSARMEGGKGLATIQLSRSADVKDVVGRSARA